MKTMNIPILIGERIRQFRISKKLSQESLAHIASLTPSYLGQVERGQRSPTLETLIKITDALGISLQDLFQFDSNYKGNSSKELAKILALLNDFDEEKLQVIYNISKDLSVLNTSHSFSSKTTK